MTEHKHQVNAAKQVDETPPPCACSDDVPATSADGIHEWGPKLLDLWRKYTDQSLLTEWKRRAA